MNCIYVNEGGREERFTERTVSLSLPQKETPVSETLAREILSVVKEREVPLDMTQFKGIPLQFGGGALLNNPLATVRYFAYVLAGNPASKEAGKLGAILVIQQRALTAMAEFVPVFEGLAKEALQKAGIPRWQIQKRNEFLVNWEKDLLHFLGKKREGVPLPPEWERTIEKLEGSLRKIDKLTGGSRNPYTFPYLWNTAKFLELDRLDRRILPALLSSALRNDIPSKDVRYVVSEILSEALRRYLYRDGIRDPKHIPLSLGRFHLKDISSWIASSEISPNLKKNLDAVLAEVAKSRTELSLDPHVKIRWEDENGNSASYSIADLYMPDLNSGVTQYVLARMGEKVLAERFAFTLPSGEFSMRKGVDFDTYTKAVRLEYQDKLKSGELQETLDVDSTISHMLSLWRISQNTALSFDTVNPVVVSILENINRLTRIGLLGLAYTASLADYAYIVGTLSVKRSIGLIPEMPRALFMTLRRKEPDVAVVNLLSKLTGTGLDSVVGATHAFAINAVANPVKRMGDVATRVISGAEDFFLHYGLLIPITDTLSRLFATGYVKSYIDVLLGFQEVRARTRHLSTAEQHAALTEYMENISKKFSLWSKERLRRTMGEWRKIDGKEKLVWNWDFFFQELEQVEKHGKVVDSSAKYADFDLGIEKWEPEIRQRFVDRLIDLFTYSVLRGDKGSLPLWFSTSVGNFLTGIARFQFFSHTRRLLADINYHDKVAIRAFLASIPITWLISELYLIQKSQAYANWENRETFWDENRRFIIPDTLMKMPGLGLFPSILMFGSSLAGTSDLQIYNYYFGRPKSTGDMLVYMAPSVSYLNSSLKSIRNLLTLARNYEDMSEEDIFKTRKKAINSLQNGFFGIGINRIWSEISGDEPVLQAKEDERKVQR